MSGSDWSFRQRSKLYCWCPPPPVVEACKEMRTSVTSMLILPSWSPLSASLWGRKLLEISFQVCVHAQLIVDCYETIRRRESIWSQCSRCENCSKFVKSHEHRLAKISGMNSSKMFCSVTSISPNWPWSCQQHLQCIFHQTITAISVSKENSSAAFIKLFRLIPVPFGDQYPCSIFQIFDNNYFQT